MGKPNIRRKETIYRGMNGRTVERIYLEGGESRILKPFDGHSREIWVYEHALPALPPVYPKMNGKWSDPGSEEAASWITFEDLGRLQHEYREELALEVVRLAARWHALPAENMTDADLKGLKPGFPELAAELQATRHETVPLAAKYGIEPDHVQAVYDRLERETVSPETVFCHGDLHVGNYADVSGRVYILDWEHAHLNSRHFDLYHVIDLSHPLYPRENVPEWRNRLLQAYMDEAEMLGGSLDRPSFVREYRLFAAVFSLWMLRLIESDRTLNRGPWTERQLVRQAGETTAVFRQTQAACEEEPLGEWTD